MSLLPRLESTPHLWAAPWWSYVLRFERDIWYRPFSESASINSIITVDRKSCCVDKEQMKFCDGLKIYPIAMGFDHRTTVSSFEKYHPLLYANLHHSWTPFAQPALSQPPNLHLNSWTAFLIYNKYPLEPFFCLLLHRRRYLVLPNSSYWGQHVSVTNMWRQIWLVQYKRVPWMTNSHVFLGVN